mgnify:CR=1 FL=1
MGDWKRVILSNYDGEIIDDNKLKISIPYYDGDEKSGIINRYIIKSKYGYKTYDLTNNDKQIIDFGIERNIFSNLYKLCRHKEMKSLIGNGVIISKNIRLNKEASSNRILFLQRYKGKNDKFIEKNIETLKDYSIVLLDIQSKYEISTNNKKIYKTNPNKSFDFSLIRKNESMLIIQSKTNEQYSEDEINKFLINMINSLNKSNGLPICYILDGFSNYYSADIMEVLNTAKGKGDSVIAIEESLSRYIKTLSIIEIMDLFKTIVVAGKSKYHIENEIVPMIGRSSIKCRLFNGRTERSYPLIDYNELVNLDDNKAIIICNIDDKRPVLDDVV